MKNSKKGSKRLTLRKKNKILKKVKEHNVAVKKLAHSKFKPPVNVNFAGLIPNSAPFKIDLLDQMEQQRDLQKNKELLEPKDDPEGNAEQQKLFELMNKNEIRQKNFYLNNREFKVVGTLEEDYMSENCIKNWSNHLEKLVDNSDLIVQVLDARNPEGTRCPMLEEKISKDASKKLLFLLNKADFIPSESLASWIGYLRTINPTLAFCSKRLPVPTNQNKLNQKQKKKPKNKQSDNHFSKLALASSNCFMTALNELKLMIPQDRHLRVCFVGMPNTGKKEVLTSIKRSLGFGRKDISKNESNDLFQIMLSPSVYLYTTPGHIYSQTHTLNDYVIRNLMKLSHLSNISQFGSAIFEFCGKDSLRRNYAFPDFVNYEEFIALIAKKNGYINKGSIPDYTAAGQKFVKDWCDGNIKYFTMPPNKDMQELLPIDNELISLIYNDQSEDDFGFQVNTLDSIKIDLEGDQLN